MASQATADTPPSLANAGYRVRSRLGTDELGEIYLADRADGGRLVALRVLRSEISADEAVAREVRRRAGLAARSALHHPTLAAVYDLGATDDGRLFVATEHVDGESLADMLRRDGPLEVSRCVRLAVQIAQGLEFLHNSAGAIHGDLRPENVTIARDGETVKLRGFELGGVRTAVRRLPAHSTVPTGPEYLAPEQMRGQALTEATDVHAFGLVVYEMLRGTPPFTGSVPDADNAASSLGEWHRDLPDSMERLLARTLDKAAERRPQDMTEVANALWAELSGIEERIAESRRRRLAWRMAGAAGLVLLTATAAWTLVSPKGRPHSATARPAPAEPPAAAILPSQNAGSHSGTVGHAVTEAAVRQTAPPSGDTEDPPGPQEVERTSPVAGPEAIPEHQGRGPTQSGSTTRRSASVVPPPPTPRSSQAESQSVSPPQASGSATAPTGSSAGQTSSERGTPADQDHPSRDAARRSTSVRTPAIPSGEDVSPDSKRFPKPLRQRPTPPPAAPSTPDPSEVIDWLLRQSTDR